MGLDGIMCKLPISAEFLYNSIVKKSTDKNPELLILFVILKNQNYVS